MPTHPTTVSHPPITPLPSHMLASQRQEYGVADAVRLTTVRRPDPGPGEVLIQVHAAGVDRGTWHVMTGMPYLMRLAGFGVRRPKVPTLGMDLSGRVVAVGEGVTRFAVGEEVFGIARGAFAEYATASQEKIVHKPAGISHEHAAVSTISGITALQALTDVGRLEAGQRVLVIGGSGGVGTFAVQLAHRLGGRVDAVAGTANLDMVRALGADQVYDHQAQSVADIVNRYDLILDIGGRNRVSALRRLLTDKGTLVIVGGEGGNRVTGGVGRQVRATLLSPFVSHRLTMFISAERLESIQRLADHLASGDVVPVIGHRAGLSEVPAAMRRMEAGTASGKTVIVINDHSQEEASR